VKGGRVGGLVKQVLDVARLIFNLDKWTSRDFVELRIRSLRAQQPRRYPLASSHGVV